MALHYSVENVKNFQKVCLDHEYDESIDLGQHMDGDYYGHDNKVYIIRMVTHHIVWACLSTGIAEVSERTLPEFWARYYTWCAMHKLTPGFTLNDLRNHIGLSTNVGKEETRAAWRKRIVDSFIDDMKWAAKRDLEKPKLEAVRDE